MNAFLSRKLAAGRVVAGAVLGALGGLVATAVALRSFEAGILGAVGGALAVMIGALALSERAEA
jgi:hypothetical protein